MQGNPEIQFKNHSIKTIIFDEILSICFQFHFIFRFLSNVFCMKLEFLICTFLNRIRNIQQSLSPSTNMQYVINCLCFIFKNIKENNLCLKNFKIL